MPDAILAALNIERRTTFWQERLLQVHGNVFVVEANGSIAGFCDLIPSRDQDANPKTIAEIAAIYVLPEHWRQGLGRALCQHALTEARRQNHTTVTLWILASNTAARHFYEAMHFTPDGATKTDRTADGTELHEVRFSLSL
ncbi:MAG: N-acetyltransferase [Pedosphaera sp.]|nr:N-acetyltransferase [Pedosphaera sp.]